MNAQNCSSYSVFFQLAFNFYKEEPHQGIVSLVRSLSILVFGAFFRIVREYFLQSR